MSFVACFVSISLHRTNQLSEQLKGSGYTNNNDFCIFGDEAIQTVAVVGFLIAFRRTVTACQLSIEIVINALEEDTLINQKDSTIRSSIVTGLQFGFLQSVPFP